MKQTHLGFTLIELMITVAIVGILASIAYPSYQDSVMKSRRADVKGVMLGLANAMERHFTETNEYLAAAVGPADTGAPSIYSIPVETANFYTVTISAATASSYTLSAVPTGVQTNDICGTLTLTHTGAKNNSAGLSQSECW
jgi:type IV pilus assembly protein PilE